MPATGPDAVISGPRSAGRLPKVAAGNAPTVTYVLDALNGATVPPPAVSYADRLPATGEFREPGLR